MRHPGGQGLGLHDNKQSQGVAKPADADSGRQHCKLTRRTKLSAAILRQRPRSWSRRHHSPNMARNSSMERSDRICSFIDVNESLKTCSNRGNAAFRTGRGIRQDTAIVRGGASCWAGTKEWTTCRRNSMSEAVA